MSLALGQSPLLLVGIAMALVALFGDGAVRLLRSVWSRMFSADRDNDLDDFVAAQRLKKRFDRLRCEDGQKAVVTIMQHFWDCRDG